MVKNNIPFIFIDEEHVKSSVSIENAYVVIQKSFILFSEQKTVTPKTISMKVDDGVFFCFPSYLKGSNIFISKLASFFTSNSEKGLPTINPYINVFDSHTGQLKCIISGRYFAGVRTAVTSAIGAKVLADKNSTTLAIIGSGVQARSHVKVFLELFPNLKKINIYGIDKRSVENLVSEQKEAGVLFQICGSSEDATASADIVVCVTTSLTPVINKKALKKNVCIIAVGSMGRVAQEVDDLTMNNAFVVIDSFQQMESYGEIMGPKSRGYRIDDIEEIGTILNKKTKFNLEGRVRVFKHHGLPVTDAALAESIYKNFVK